MAEKSVKKHLKKLHNDESGILTLDFIFSTVIVFAFTAILFAVSLTLTVSYIVQYMTFASARVFFAGHVNQDQQIQLGQEKFQQLRDNQVFAPLFSGGWYELGEPQVGNHNDLYPQSDAPSEDSSTFWGTRVAFNAKILEMRIPYLGVTTTEEDSFSANLGSYLAREPTREECLSDFTEIRLNNIRNLNGAYNQGAVGEYAVFIDNGC